MFPKHSTSTNTATPRELPLSVQVLWGATASYRQLFSTSFPGWSLYSPLPWAVSVTVSIRVESNFFNNIAIKDKTSWCLEKLKQAAFQHLQGSMVTQESYYNRIHTPQVIKLTFFVRYRNFNFLTTFLVTSVPHPFLKGLKKSLTYRVVQTWNKQQFTYTGHFSILVWPEGHYFLIYIHKYHIWGTREATSST